MTHDRAKEEDPGRGRMAAAESSAGMRCGPKEGQIQQDQASENQQASLDRIRERVAAVGVGSAVGEDAAVR